MDDVVDGELEESAQRLGVEQEDESGDAAAQRQVLIGEQPTRSVPGVRVL
jgi:hypothetical protein